MRTRGDEAVLAYTDRFDKLPLTAATLAFSADEIEAAEQSISGEVRAALQLAHDRIAAHHEKQKPLDHVYQDPLGVTLGTVWTPMEAVGIYVPGGTANYPSSVLMGAIPARIAGVGRIALTVPTPHGQVSPAVLAGRRRSPPSPTAPRPSSRSTRSSGRATPMWRRPSGRCSARSASIRSPGRRRC